MQLEKEFISNFPALSSEITTTYHFNYILGAFGQQTMESNALASSLWALVFYGWGKCVAECAVEATML